MTYTLTSFGAALAVALSKHDATVKRNLERAAKMLETESKRVIGTYEYGWTPLAASTLARKAADTPLLETGEMRASIEHKTFPKEAYVGSNNQKAVWQELGTDRIPPRSFLGEAAHRKEKEIQRIVGDHTAQMLLP